MVAGKGALRSISILEGGLENYHNPAEPNKRKSFFLRVQTFFEWLVLQSTLDDWMTK